MLIAFAVVCTLCEAVFTALEVALGAVSRARLKALLENGGDAPDDSSHREAQAGVTKRRARLALQLLERPDRLALVFITVTSLTMWATAALLTWHALTAQWAWWMLLLALVGVLFIAEVVPLLIAARHTEAIALGGARLAHGSMTLMTPLMALVAGLGQGAARLLGADHTTTPSVTEGELRSVLASAEEEGVIESDERALLESAMDFRDKVVREVMTPRVDVIGVASDTPLHEVLRRALDKGHSRLPVYEDSLDHVVGIIAAKDLLPALRDGTAPSRSAAEAMRPPFFVPEDKRVASTLEELRRQRSLLAVVVDADGGTAGLVTLEDLLEEIVGEIQDEYDAEEPPLSALEGAPAVRGEAGVTVRDFGRFWERHYGRRAELRDFEGEPAEASQSLAALALNLFDGVPQEGDRTRAGVVAQDEDEAPLASLEMQILKMNGPRIEAVQVAEVEEPE